MTEQLEEAATSIDDKIEGTDDNNRVVAEATDNKEIQKEEKSEVEDEVEEEERVEPKNDNETDDEPKIENETEIKAEDEDERETTSNSAINIDFSSINYKDFEKIDQEQIDLYYMLNDNKNNAEFLNEDLVALSKREEEIKALKEKEKEEFDFKMEELVSDGDEVKVDLTGIIDDLEIEKEK